MKRKTKAEVTPVEKKTILNNLNETIKLIGNLKSTFSHLCHSTQTRMAGSPLTSKMVRSINNCLTHLDQSERSMKEAIQEARKIKASNKAPK